MSSSEVGNADWACSRRTVVHLSPLHVVVHDCPGTITSSTSKTCARSGKFMYLICPKNSTQPARNATLLCHLWSPNPWASTTITPWLSIKALCITCCGCTPSMKRSAPGALRRELSGRASCGGRVGNEARVVADVKDRRKEKGRRLGARGKTGLNWIFGLRPLD